MIETFILFEDKVGLQLHEALMAAARRGVQVDMTIDDWGSPDLSQRFIAALREAGVRLHVFDPGPRPFGLRPQPAAPHAPQDRGGRRRGRLRRRHQLLGRPPGRLRPRSQAGLRGGDPRPAGGRDPPLLPRRAGRRPAPRSRTRASGGAGASSARQRPTQLPAAGTRRRDVRGRATTARTRTTSSATTASRSAPRASASSSPTPTSSPATGSSRSCGARPGAASTCA